MRQLDKKLNKDTMWNSTPTTTTKTSCSNGNEHVTTLTLCSVHCTADFLSGFGGRFSFSFPLFHARPFLKLVLVVREATLGGGVDHVEDVLGEGAGVLQEVLGPVAPLLDDGLLHPARVVLGVHADLLGNLDAVGLLDQSAS